MITTMTIPNIIDMLVSLSYAKSFNLLLEVLFRDELRVVEAVLR